VVLNTEVNAKFIPSVSHIRVFHGFVLVKRLGTTLPAPLLGPKVMGMVLQTNYIKISNSHIRRGKHETWKDSEG
jgi:hypothetical protein